MGDYQINPYSEDAQPERIAPEGAKVANTYLANGCSIHQTSLALKMPTHEISAVLHEPLVKNYVTSILREYGYSHMVQIAEKMDELISTKWTELEEAEIGSNKDIADLLALAHKFRMDMSKMLQADTKAEPGIQHNTQVNVYGKGQYGKLMKMLTEKG